MNKRYFLILLFLFTSACAKMLVAPDIQKVNKLAVVSIYMNGQLYNIKEDKTAGKAGLLKTLVKNTVKAEAMYPEETLDIITFGLEEYIRQLSSVGTWTIMPSQQLLTNDKYLSYVNAMSDNSKVMGLFEKAENTKWRAPDNMKPIKIESLTDKSDKNNKNMKEVLSALCKELGLDAAAVIKLDVGYTAGMKLGAGLPLNKTKIKPSIKPSMVIISKTGEIALKTPGGGTRYRSDPVMVTTLAGAPVLNDKEGKAVNAFKTAVANSAAGLKENIEEAFNKLK